MLSFCNTCKKHNTCQEICKKLNKYLNKLHSKQGYHPIYVKQKEIPIDPDVLETTIAWDWVKRREGRRKPSSIDEE